MSKVSVPRHLPGLLATAAFAVLLYIPGWLGAPPFRLASWMGSWVTTNLFWASLAGTLFEFAIGMGIAEGYHRWKIPHRSAQSLWQAGGLFGIAIWFLGGTIGFKALTAVSPFLRHGLGLAPGILGNGLGPAGSFTWALAVGVYTMLVVWLSGLGSR